MIALMLLCLIVILGIVAWQFRPPSKKEIIKVSSVIGKVYSSEKIPLPNSSYDELEQWWETTQSKDAEISKLKKEIESYESKYARYDGMSYFDLTMKQDRIIDEQKATLKRIADENRDKFLAVYNGPSEIPKNPHITTQLTFRGQQLVEWSQTKENSQW